MSIYAANVNILGLMPDRRLLAIAIAIIIF